MVESADYTPAPDWTGHNFTRARASFDAHAGRSYADATRAGKTARDLAPAEISTDSTCPLVILTDETGSMGSWPATIFSKLPYLEHEAMTEYLGQDVEISFGAIGDAFSDNFPLQARPFTRGAKLKTSLEELVIESNGGGQVHESYELIALYYARNVAMPKAIRPVLIMTGDEMPYDFIDPDKAMTYAGIKIEGRMSAEDIFAELQEKYEVFMILKPYNTDAGDDDRTNRDVYRRWANLLGADHVAPLPDPHRVVDVIFGILAKVSGRIDYFRKEIEGRQKPAQVQAAYRSLKTIHALPPGTKAKPSGQSTMRRDPGGKTSDPLV